MNTKLCLALIVITALLRPSLILAQPNCAPEWLNDNTLCLGYQQLPNRTFVTTVEYGRSTDFTDIGDCARWCGWTEECWGLEWVHHITQTEGGCYDINRPCCIIYSSVDPDYGYMQECALIDTCIVDWVHLREDIPCDPNTCSQNMALYYGDPYIWYDYGNPPCGNTPACCGTAPAASQTAASSALLSDTTTSTSVHHNPPASWSTRLNHANSAHATALDESS